MPKKNRFLFQVILLLSVALIWPGSAALADVKSYRVVLHVHSTVSGERTTLEEIALYARKLRVDAVILTEYFQQKISWGPYPLHSWMKISYERPSVLKGGAENFFAQVARVQSKIPDVILIPGVEATPYYSWSGSLWKGNWTVHDMQKNLLVAGLAADALKKLPTIENHSGFDFYHVPRPPEAPAQRLIDYADREGGLSIWSTPDEAFGADFQKGPVHFKTPAYTQALLETDQYTGIALYPEGILKSAPPGGVWDQLLMAYAQGKRSLPVWAFAESVIHQKSFLRNFARWDQIVLAENKTPDALLAAMKHGRSYIRKCAQGMLWLDDFSLTDLAGHSRAFLGETLITSGPVKVYARIRAEGKFFGQLQIKLIKNGQTVLAQETSETSYDLEWQDTQGPVQGTADFYRVEAGTSPQRVGTLHSNPIFARASSD